MCAQVGSKLTEAARDLGATEYVAPDSFSPFYTFYSDFNLPSPSRHSPNSRSNEGDISNEISHRF